MATRSKKEPLIFISKIHATGSASSESVEILNGGSAPADVSLWTLAASNGQKISLPDGMILWPGQRVVVYSQQISPVTGGLSFQSDRPVWNAKADTARLQQTDGKVVATYRHSAERRGATITNLRYLGDEKRTEGDEYVEITNLDTYPADVSGWRLEAGDGKRSFTFPAGSTIAPLERVFVFTNRDQPETGGYSFRSKTQVWDNDGSVARLVDAKGKLRSAFAYGGKAAPDGADVAIAAGQHRVPAAQIPAGPRAILMGLNYKGTPLEVLRGAQRDVIDMFALLTRDLGFDPRNVTILTDDAVTASTLQKPFLAPTCETVESLITGWSSRAGDKDSLFLHFSGHGAQVKDEDGDEADGLDEALMLSDRPMVDDALLHVLTGPMTHDPRVFALVDSCHSGTVLDLKFTMGADGKIARDERRAPVRGTLTCLAAADDAEEAADARSADGFVGVLSYAFRKVLKAHPKGLTYRGLLRGVSELFAKGKLEQSPKLSFNLEGFDVDQPLPFAYAGPAEPIGKGDAVFTEVTARGCGYGPCCGCSPPWACSGYNPCHPPPCCPPCPPPSYCNPCCGYGSRCGRW